MLSLCIYSSKSQATVSRLEPAFHTGTPVQRGIQLSFAASMPVQDQSERIITTWMHCAFIDLQMLLCPMNASTIVVKRERGCIVETP